jgi:hypothetical protein
LRHYDLDDIALLGAFVRDLETSLPAALARALPDGEAAELQTVKHPPLERRRQTALSEDRTWRVKRGEAAVLVKAEIVRFVCAPAGVVDNTLELFLASESPRAGAARLLLLFLMPLLGLLTGLTGWLLLQSDTNMESTGWLIVGGLAGFGLGLAIVERGSAWLGALLDGRGAFSSRANRRAALAAATAEIDRLIAVHRERTRALAATAAPPPPPADDPKALAAYAAELTADPDAGIVKYGLLAAANRDAIARAFARVEHDATLFHTYQESRKRPASV